MEKKRDLICWISVILILAIICPSISAVPVPLYNTLRGYDGHHSQEDSPAQPAFLLADGLDVTFVWPDSADPVAWETVTFDTEGAHFGTVYAGDEGRNYIRTLETDHASASFDAYITVVNYADGQNVFIGMGAGEYGQYMCPDWLDAPTVWAELMEGAVNVLIWDGTNEDFLKPGGKVPASSTYLMRLSYDAEAQTIVFYTDADNDGSWDDISKECDVSNVFGEDDLTRVYVGTDDGGVLVDFEVRPANPYMAYNHDPRNGATLVPIEQILSWQVGDEAADALFDVYLGTDPNEEDPDWYGNNKVVDKGSDTFYDPDPDLLKDKTYYWRVDVYEPNEAGPDDILHTGVELSFMTVPAIPVILTQPASQTVEVGSNVTFNIEGLNFSEFAWYKEGSPTLLSDQQQLTLENIQIADEGRYYCAVTNEFGTVMSDMAGLWTKRLMAYWTFDNTLDSSQPLGSVWTGVAYNYDDVLGDTVISPVYDVGGLSGQALSFSADPNHVRITDSADFFNFHINGFTTITWVKTNETGEWKLAVSTNNLDKTAGWGLGCYSAEGFANIRGTGVGDDYYGGSDLGDGQWHLIASQYDPDRETYSLYVDGLRVAESPVFTVSLPESESPLIIGAEDIHGGAGFNGLIDELSIYSYAVDAYDIAHIYTDIMTDETVCVDNVGLQFDVSGPEGEPDCRVDLLDFVEWAATWMNCNIVPECK